MESKMGLEFETWIKDRDREILRVIYEEQFLSISVVSKYFFDGALPTASKRLSKLRKMKLLRYEILDLPGKPKVVRLSAAGAKFIKTISPFSIAQKIKTPVTTFIHDQIVSEVRLELSKRFDAEWVPEKAMKAKRLHQIPDGILVFPSGKRIAIEVENSSKGSARYARIWKDWESQDFLVIVYVATTDVVHRSLIKKMSGFQSQKVCLALLRLDELMRSSDAKLWTPAGEIALFDQRMF